MIAIRIHRPRPAVCLLLLCTAAAAFAQSDLERAAALVEQLEASIASEQAQHGVRSEALIPLFTQLGHLYRDLGHIGRAAAAFEEARSAVRANVGLSSLDEAPLLRELMHIAEGLGDVKAAWEVEHRLLALADAHPEDLRAADVYRAMGDKRLDLLSKYFAGDFPPQLVLGCYYHGTLAGDVESGDPNCTAGSRGRLVRAVFAEAWRYYTAAADALAANELYSSAELRDLEMRIVGSSYAVGAYSVGRQHLERLLAYEVANDQPSSAGLNALVQLADWDIVTNAKTDSRDLWSSALETYEQVYAKLRRDGADSRSIDALFSPEVPIVVPAFQPNPFMACQTSITSSHIDIAFEITKYGRSRRVEVLNTTTAVPRDVAKSLVAQISNSLFRPRIIDGRIASAAPVTLRCYQPVDSQ